MIVHYLITQDLSLSLLHRGMLNIKSSSSSVYTKFVFQTLSKVHEWHSLHQHPGESPCPCTCISTQGNDMAVSAGEDGRINVLNLGSRKPVRIIGRCE